MLFYGWSGRLSGFDYHLHELDRFRKMTREIDKFYMREALKEAQIAFNLGETPVGAVIVQNGQIIGRGHNLRETQKNALLHAEIIAIETACKQTGGWRLLDATLYVTLEPCPMCAGAVINSRIDRVVYGAKDARAGSFGSLIDLSCVPYNHCALITGGVLADECQKLLQNFFISLRTKNNKPEEKR